MLKMQGRMIEHVNRQWVSEGKKDRSAAARTNLAFLQRAIPHLLEARRTTQSDHLEQVKALLSVDQLKQPSAAKATLRRGADGSLSSGDPFIDAVLKFVDAKYPGELARLGVPNGASLSLPLEAAVLLQAKQFEYGCKVRQIDVDDSEQPISVDIDLKTYTARQAIKNGARGFSEGARLDLDLSRLRADSTREHPDAAPAAAKASPDVHPFAFLQDVAYRVESDHGPLKQLIERAFNDHEPAHLWPATLELRGRLGAHAVNTVFNQKTFDWQLGAAMALSVIGSSAIAGAIDQWAIKPETKMLDRKLGKKPALKDFLEVASQSVVPMPAEIFDSGIVKRIIEKLRGNSLLPESREAFIDDMKDAATSGLIAALGSVLNNAMQLSKSGLAIAGGTATNALATATSAAMAPLEVAHAQNEMVAGVLQQRRNAFFSTPEAGPASLNRAQTAAALAKEVDRDVQGALDTMPGVSQTITSMGIGQVLSLAANFGVFMPLARAHLISEMVLKIGNIATNTPTEVLSLGTGILTSKFGRLGFTSDANKERLIAAMILDKARQRIDNINEGKPDESVKITEDELRKIEHPGIELTFTTGKKITDLMNATVDLFARMAGREPTLAERAALANARPTIEEV
ncbi:hypothetical protein C0Z17_04195 [Trinickia caryophylli]|nr:hypothetical protein C0Z17_04195 [Trinickia caryophylli]